MYKFVQKLYTCAISRTRLAKPAPGLADRAAAVDFADVHPARGPWAQPTVWVLSVARFSPEIDAFWPVRFQRKTRVALAVETADRVRAPSVFAHFLVLAFVDI
jgi:hypothetical protein